MKAEHAAGVVQGFEALFARGATADRSDADLLERFVTRRGEPAERAFEALVARHGPMVWSVCRRVLGGSADADDAFQATFLVLARRAATIRGGGALGTWLHRVARHTALRARSGALRRGQVERQAIPDHPRPDAPQDRDELRAVLDEELDRLPLTFRAPLVLCYLEGLTHDQAAARLGCPVGTVRSRLARGRDRLRDRLVRRGLAPTTAALAALATAESAPAALVSSTSRLAALVAVGEAASAGPAAAAALGLMRAVSATMVRNRVASALALLILAVGTVGAGALWIAPTRPTESPRLVGSKRASQIDDREAIQGIWKVVELEQPNHKTTEEEAAFFRSGGFTVTITADRITYKTDGSGAAHNMDGSGAAYTLDPSRSPKRMRMGVGVGAAPAIYRLEGDRLWICQGRAGDLEPPSSFDIADRKPSEFPTLLVMERLKGDEPKPAPRGTWADLNGGWDVVSVVDDGRTLSPAEAGFDEVSILDDWLIYTLDGHPYSEWQVRERNPDASPRSFGFDSRREVTKASEKSTQRYQGIYKLDGDVLTLCVQVDPLGLEPAPPDAFRSRPASGNVLITLKRWPEGDRRILRRRSIQGTWRVGSVEGEAPGVPVPEVGQNWIINPVIIRWTDAEGHASRTFIYGGNPPGTLDFESPETGRLRARTRIQDRGTSLVVRYGKTRPEGIEGRAGDLTVNVVLDRLTEPPADLRTGAPPPPPLDQ